MRKLSAEERNRIEVVVAAAKTRTSAEFAVAVARASDDYALFPLLWAGLLEGICGQDGADAIRQPGDGNLTGNISVIDLRQCRYCGCMDTFTPMG